MPPPDGLSGGDKLMAVLNRINDRLAGQTGAPSVAVGFLETKTYADGESVASVAATLEFGGRIEREPSDPDEGGGQTIYRKVNAAGTAFTRNGRFVKAKDSNFASTRYVGAYVITIPPRPFFRNMIKANAPAWGGDMAKLLKSDDYDSAKVLGQMGELIARQLRQSILDTNEPPNAPSTIRDKGFAKPLIGKTRTMWNSVDYKVTS